MGVYVHFLDHLIDFIEPGTYAITNCNGEIFNLYKDDGTQIHFSYAYEWEDFIRSVDYALNSTTKLSFVVIPRPAITFEYCGCTVTIETSVALEAINKPFSKCFDNNPRAVIRISVVKSSNKPLSDRVSYSSDIVKKAIDDANNIAQATAKKPEEKVPAEKLNAKSADKIKAIMQQTMTAVETSKEVPVEYNHNPYLEPSRPSASATPEQQSKNQDKIMADLAKKLEEATNKASVEIDNSDWDEDEDLAKKLEDASNKASAEIDSDSWDDDEEKK